MWRPAADDGEGDAALVQFSHRRYRAFGQEFLRRDQRSIHV
jgi:hypothetical protein